MPTIYNHKGEPLALGDAPSELMTEFATRLTTGVDVGSFLGRLPDPDPVLRKRGDSAEVLEDLTADDQVCMAMQNRKIRVLNNQDYEFSPGQAKGVEATSQAIQLCADLVADMERINLRNVLSAVLDAPFFGLTVLELMWEPRDGKLRLMDIVAKPRKWFSFDDHNQPVFCGDWFGEARPLPKGKFVLTRHFPSYENPYGLRLLSRCLWPVAFKRGGIEFLTRFCEKFGQPWILAHAPHGAERSARMEMANDLAAMVQDAVAVLPSGANVEIASASVKVGDLHESYLRRWDKSISKVLMGQTLTAEMDGTGSRAASETHYSVGSDIADADIFLVVSTLNDIALVYRDINWPQDVLAPVFAYREPSDYSAQAELDNKLFGIGVRFAKQHFTRRYGLAEDEFSLVGSEGSEGREVAPTIDHAESEFVAAEEAQDVVDQAVAEFLPAAVRANDKTVKAIERVVAQAESFEDMQILLAELLGAEMEEDEFFELLARISLNARSFGIVAAMGETDASDN